MLGDSLIGDVPLYHRRELPPGRVGIAKPPYELAGRSGQIAFAETLTKFSGALFDKIVESRAANEQADFQGFADTEIERVRTYVAANPNLPFAEYEKAIKGAVANIKKAGRKTTTGIAKDANARWMASNLNLVSQRMLTDAEAELSNQEFIRAETQRKAYIADFDPEGLVNHSEKMVAAGTYDAETEDARLEIEVAAITTNLEEQSVYRFINMGAYEAAEEMINQAEYLSPEQKNRLTDEVYSTRNRERIQANREQVLIEDEARKQATDLMVDEELSFEWLRHNRDKMAEDDYERFNKYLLQRRFEVREEKELEQWLSERWRLISDVTDGIDDLRMGKGDPIEIKMKIDELAKLGRQGVADAEQYRGKLSEALKTRPGDLLTRPVVKSGFETLSRLRNQFFFAPPEESSLDKEGNLILSDKGILENELKSLALRNDFENFVRSKPDVTDADIEMKIAELVRPYRKERSLGFWSRTFRFRKKRWLFGLIESEIEREFPYRGMEKKKFDFGLRPDGTPRGDGFLGVLGLKGGGIATEYSFGTTDVTGEEMDIPSLVPTLTQKEIKVMTDDIIPNRKPIPRDIARKAVVHAKKRLNEGKSVFAEVEMESEETEPVETRRPGESINQYLKRTGRE